MKKGLLILLFIVMFVTISACKTETTTTTSGTTAGSTSASSTAGSTTAGTTTAATTTAATTVATTAATTTAETTATTTTPTEPIETFNIVDGVIEDGEYDVSPFHFGSFNASTVLHKLTDDGIYLAFDIKDTTLFANTQTNLFERLGLSDSIEVFLDLDLNKGTLGQSDDIQIRFDPEGTYVVLRGGQTTAETTPWLAWAGVDFTIDEFDVLATGTLSDNSDQDTGYVAEMYLSWTNLGTTPKTEVGFSVLFRDVFNGTGWIPWWQEQNVDRPNNYYILNENGIGLPSVASDVTIDGDLSDAKWSESTVTTLAYETTPYPVEVKTFLGTNGLHLAVNVDDEKLTTQFGYQWEIWQNDGFELRIDSDNNGAWSDNDRKIIMDINGMEWLETRVGTAFVRDGSSIEVAGVNDGTVGDATDTDGGWTIELFIPYSELGLTDPAAGTTVGVFVAIMNHDGSTNTPYLNTGSNWDELNTYVDITK